LKGRGQKVRGKGVTARKQGESSSRKRGKNIQVEKGEGEATFGEGKFVRGCRRIKIAKKGEGELGREGGDDFFHMVKKSAGKKEKRRPTCTVGKGGW